MKDKVVTLKKRTPDEMFDYITGDIRKKADHVFCLASINSINPELTDSEKHNNFARACRNLESNMEKAIQKFELDLKGEDEPF
jgi:hypothetical protein